MPFLSEPMLVPIGVIAIITAAKWLQTRKEDRAFALSHGCKPPAKLSRFRNIIQQIKAIKSHTWLDMWFHRYTDVAATFESATVSIEPIIFTNEPENIKTILATDFKTFELGDRRRRLMGPLVGPGIFSNDGQAWRHSRTLIRPNFSKLQISDLSTFETHFQDLLVALPPVNGFSNLVEVDLQPLFFRMTLDSASELLLGHDMAFRSQSDPPGSASLRFLDAFDYAQKKIHRRDALNRGWMKPFGVVSSLLKGTKKDKFDIACGTVHSVMDNIIGEFLRSRYQRPFSKEEQDGEEGGANKKYVFLDAMAETTLDPLELRYEILNVLIAGRDTTGSLLSNVFFMLARHPDTWASVRAEVDETFKGKLPDYNSLNNMKQVRNLLNECLRLFPPVPFNMRTATSNTTLPKGGGPDGEDPVFVKDGQQVDYHPYALHRLEASFGPDAEDFRPERWDNPALRPGWGYIPFNGGARICLGQQLALTEAAYTVVRLMQEFSSITRRDKEEEWHEQISLVTKSRRGTRVALRKTEKGVLS